MILEEVELWRVARLFRARIALVEGRRFDVYSYLFFFSLSSCGQRGTCVFVVCDDRVVTWPFFYEIDTSILEKNSPMYLGHHLCMWQNLSLRWDPHSTS
jgi:hypothetical protein